MGNVSRKTVEKNKEHVLCSITFSMAIYVRGTYRQTQLFYWLIIVRFTTTCFGPIPGPSSDCITTYSRLYYMLLIGNGCFGELSIILRVTMVCVFFHSIYNNISTGIKCPGVSCKYDTYRILLNMCVQNILFVSILVWLL